MTTPAYTLGARRRLDVTDDLTVRRYRPSDRDRVLALHEAAMRDVGAYVKDAPESDLADIPGTYLDSGGEFLVGTHEERLVAMGAFRPADWYITEFLACDEATAELKRLRVAPDEQRRGFGQTILDALVGRARDRGYDEFVLDTTPGQTGARRFFEANSFDQVGRDTIEAPEETVELLFYRKPLEG